MKNLGLILSLLIIMVIVGTGCANTSNSGESTTSRPVDTQASVNTVKIENFAFKPEVLRIKNGDIVTWKQNDSAVHTIISTGLFDSPTLNLGDEFVYSFKTVGEYEYHCGIHPSMKGKIIVQ